MGNPIPAQPWTGQERFWSQLTIEDREVPGLAAVEVERENKVDKKKAKAENNSKKESAGADDAKVKITIRILTKAAHDTFTSEILPIIEPTPGKKTLKPIAAKHATLAARQVPAIVVLKVRGPVIKGGLVEYEIDAEEQRAPTPAPRLGKGGAPAFGNCADLYLALTKAQNAYVQARGRIGALDVQLAQAQALPFATNTQNEIRLQREQAISEADAAQFKASVIEGTMRTQKCPQVVPPKPGPKTVSGSGSAGA